MPSASIRATWSGLRKPPDDATLAATPVPRSNAWVFKTHIGGFGLLLSGVDPPRNLPPLRNIEISYKPEKIVNLSGKESSLLSCVEVRLSPECDADTLASIVDRLGEKEPSGSFTTQSLIGIIRDVIEVVKPPPFPPGIEEVAGAWGELYFLSALVSKATTHVRQMTILSGWQADRPTGDILDFRFRHADLVVEVKTGLGERVHHIRGFTQVTVPEGYASGYLASILARRREDRAGITCGSLVEGVLRVTLGNVDEKKVFARAFEEKLDSRGREIRDNSIALHAEDPPIVFVRLSEVPRPTPAPMVTHVQWMADVRGVPHLAAHEADSLVNTIVS